MKTTFLILLLSFACYASADHLDVQPFKLLDTCTPQQYASIMDDFNDWGKAYSYQTELAVPLQSDDLLTVVWLGRSPNAEAFGKAWDAWRDAQTDSNSVPAKLAARFSECGAPSEERRSYDTY